MSEYTCYMLRLLSGDTYIGVTGQSLGRRVSQHIREQRISGEFEVIVLGFARSRVELNLLEKAMIAIHRPNLNRIKGGTSIDGYRHGESPRRKEPLRPRKRKKPKPPRGKHVYCRKGHELTSEGKCPKCRKAYLAAYYEKKLRPAYLKSS